MICLSCLGLRKILNRSLFLNLVLGHIAERNCQPKQQYLQKIKEFLQCVKKTIYNYYFISRIHSFKFHEGCKTFNNSGKIWTPPASFFLRNRQEHHTIAEE